jgi:uncharacterized membrane protein YjdF
MTYRTNNNRFAISVLVAFLVIWTALAINPSYRHDWLLENVLVFLGVPVLVLNHRYLPLSPSVANSALPIWVPRAMSGTHRRTRCWRFSAVWWRVS